jgi:plastocyanin
MKRLLLGVALATFGLGCGGGGEAASEGGAEQGGEAAAAGGAVAPAGSATVSGTVSFAGTPPENPAVDMAEEAACAQEHSGQPRDPVVAVKDGKLAAVVVYVKSGLPAGQSFPVPGDAVTLDQDGCLYHPRHFAVMAGQKVEIKNSDGVLHNIKAVPKENRGFNISQPSEGMTTTRTFARPESDVPFECNVHGWMKANAMVLPHPFFATTGEDGTFTIRGLPAGTYEIEAHHQTLGTRTMSVTVPDGGSATADFSFGTATS